MLKMNALLDPQHKHLGIMKWTRSFDSGFVMSQKCKHILNKKERVQ